MTTTFIASAKVENTNGALTAVLTVPTGVTTSHLGIIVTQTVDSGSDTATIPNWIRHVSNPTGKGNQEVALFTRLGGHAATGTITATFSAGNNVTMTGFWFDTQGRDIESIGTVYVRNGVSGNAIQFPGVSVPGDRDIILVAADRTLGTPTVSSWTPSTPGTVTYSLSTDRSSRAHGALTAIPSPQTGAGTTPTYTATFSATSGNAIGIQFVVAPPAADTTAPTVPGNVIATANSDTQITINWDASTDAVGVASYRLRRGGVDVPGATALTGLSYVDTGLTASTLYSYTVSAVDAAGNRSAESTAAPATTQASPDTTAPTVPTGVTATANSATQVTINWTASTDAVGVTSYRVRRGGVDLSGATAVTGTSFVDSTVSSSTFYSYTVSARDAANNRSAESTPGTVTTPAATSPAIATTGPIQWEMSTTAMALGWVIDTGTSIRAVASLSSSFTSPIYGSTLTTPASKWVTSRITGLSANTSYYVGIEVDGTLIATGRGQFKTLKTGVVASKIVAGSCQQTGSNVIVFDRMLAEGADFLAHMGDAHYGDVTPYVDATWRTAFLSSLSTAKFKAMAAALPIVYAPDNHDGPGSNTLPGSDPWGAAVSSNVRQMAGEIYDVSTKGFYKTWAHAGVRYIMLDVWSFRNASTDTNSSSKTMLGTTQRSWFINLLQTAAEAAIVVFGHFPNYSNLVAGGRWGDFPDERITIGNAITALPANQKNKIIFIGGDSHAINADDGTNAMWGRPSLNASPFNQSGGLSSGTWNIANINVDDTKGYFSRLTFTPSGSNLNMVWDAVQDDGTVMATWSKSFPVPSTTMTIKVWNGTTEVNATLDGVWNGTTTVPVTFKRWDGTAEV